MTFYCTVLSIEHLFSFIKQHILKHHILNIFTVFNNKHCENMIFDNHSFKTEIYI